MTRSVLRPATVVYCLYGLSFFLLVTTLVGVVYAYISKGRNSVLDTHLRFLIRTFWIHVALIGLALIGMLIGVGRLLAIFTELWFLVRIVSGFLLALDRKPITGSRYLGMLAV